ncbi:MAG: class I SAM-dependent methyltransferase [Planctomycetia bacterium]|jgi:ubiquinone/menaquinone biosynthesis C-methylase UbiE|nr:class I SAM-dependent methyltransferase [Planctomycetia bacterium]
MGFYSRVIFPRICNFVLDTPLVAEQRKKVLESAGGEVLEIGFGSGLNLTHYPPSVRKITAVDPNPGMNGLAQRRIKQTGRQVEQRLLSGEKLPLEDGSFDCVVSTFTLCSIDSVERSLSEVFRVLRPGGQFLFLEHGLSPEGGVQRWQRRLNWLQQRIGDGCRLDRDMQTLISRQPFAAIQSEQFYLAGMPKTHGYMYRGIARK